MPRRVTQGFDNAGSGRPKRQVGYGPHCAGGSPPFNDGRAYKDGKCQLCGRAVARFKDGHVQPHSWQNPLAEAELERRAREG